jgi:hypothetical protein
VCAEHHRRSHQDGAERVDVAADPQSLVLGDPHPSEQERQHADRNVDEEDPVPVERLSDHPTCDQPERGAARDDEHVHAHRLRALARLGELGRDDRDDRRGRAGTAKALNEAGDDE